MTFVADLITAQWAQEVRVESAWDTAIMLSPETDQEQRRSLVERPRRTMTVTWLVARRAHYARLMAQLHRMGAGIQGVPLYSDMAVATQTRADNLVYVPVVREFVKQHRFFAGFRVVLWEQQGGVATNVRERTIASVSDDHLTLTANVATTAGRTRVAPVLVVEPVRDPVVRPVTDQVAEVSATFLEADAGPSSEVTRLPAIATFPTSLDDVGYEQVDLGGLVWYFFAPAKLNWGADVGFGLTRQGYDYDTGRGHATELAGTRPRAKARLSFLTRRRTDFFYLLMFMEAARGRALPFWVGDPMTTLHAVAISVSYVDVTKDVAAADLALSLRHLHVREGLDANHVREVDAITDNGDGTLRIALATNLPAIDLADVTSVEHAYFVRFASDAFVEQWQTNEVTRATVEVIEVVRGGGE